MKIKHLTSEAEVPDPGYDDWLRAKVRASLEDHRPSLSHEQVMAEVDRVLAEALAKRQRRGSEQT